MTAGGRLWTGTAATVLAAATLAGVVPRRAAAAAAFADDNFASLASAAISQEVADVTRQDLARLAARLNDPSAPQELRDDAARRLVARRNPDARKIVADALVNLNVGGQLAAARALADETDPDPALINPLFAVLGANRPLTEAAARALAAYKSNPDVTARLIAFAQRPAASEVARLAVIRAIGSIPDRRAAEFLVGVLQNPNESAAARATAAEALADLSGQSDLGADPARWGEWWAQNGTKPEQQFRADLLPGRSAREDRAARRAESLAAALRAIVNEQYRATPAAQRPDLLLKHLRGEEPQLRAVAAGIVYDEAREGRPPRADVRDQLRELIGDSDPAVRASVAEAFATINDAASFDALLAQLAQETDPAVRASLARALAPIKDLRAVPVLTAMLSDSSLDAAGAAANAIKLLGPEIVKQDPELARRTAVALRDALERRAAGAPQTAAFRETLVGAMGPLRQPELLSIFTRMLDERRGESVEMRVLAIKAIGEIARPESAGVLIAPMEDREPRIRSAAVQALQTNPALADNAEALRARLDPQREPSPDVRDAAWVALQTVFPQLSKEQLVIWAERFQGNPERHRLVLQTLRDQQIRDRDEGGLATTRATLGQVEMKLKNYKDAAREFGLALEYEKARPAVPGAVKESLMSARMGALLLDRDFVAAVAFAAQMIEEDAANAQVFGRLIWNEAQRLRDAGELQAALDLIAAAKEMKPQLSDKYRDELASIEKDINAKRNQQNGATPLPGSRSAAAELRDVVPWESGQ